MVCLKSLSHFGRVSLRQHDPVMVELGDKVMHCLGLQRNLEFVMVPRVVLYQELQKVTLHAQKKVNACRWEMNKMRREDQSLT